MAGSPKLTQKNGRRMAGGKPIPASDFALPGQQYPIDTPGRARDALSRVAANGTPAEQTQVKAAVRKKYPNIAVDGKPSAKQGATGGRTSSGRGGSARGRSGGTGKGSGGKGK